MNWGRVIAGPIDEHVYPEPSRATLSTLYIRPAIPTLAVLSSTLHALAEEALRGELKHPWTLRLVIAAQDIDSKSRRLQSMVCIP